MSATTFPNNRQPHSSFIPVFPCPSNICPMAPSLVIPSYHGHQIYTFPSIHFIKAWTDDATMIFPSIIQSTNYGLLLPPLLETCICTALLLVLFVWITYIYKNCHPLQWWPRRDLLHAATPPCLHYSQSPAGLSHSLPHSWNSNFTAPPSSPGRASATALPFRSFDNFSISLGNPIPRLEGDLCGSTKLGGPLRV
jgi:hypothetical protein